MIRRSLGGLAAVCVLWVAVACLDIASPTGGIGSISSVLLPSPSVVVGDSLFDTSGNYRPLQVHVFAPNGEPVQDATTRFFALDSTNGLRVDSTTGGAFGGSLSLGSKVVAEVRSADGNGVIQTQQVLLPVVQQPTAVGRDTDFTFTPNLASPDTLSSLLISPAITVTVKGADGTGVPSYPVVFILVQTPDSIDNKGPSVRLTTSSGRDTTVAVTGPGGQASIYLRLRPSSIKPELVVTPQSVIVRYEVRSHRDTLAPADPFTIPVRPVLVAP
jgi:hypothetical protein